MIVPNFTGYVGHAHHRTDGPHRAWCDDCHGWCYPDSSESGCCACCAGPRDERDEELLAIYRSLSAYDRTMLLALAVRMVGPR